MNVQEVQLRHFAPESSRVPFSPDRSSFGAGGCRRRDCGDRRPAVDRRRAPLKAIDAARRGWAPDPDRFGDGASISEVADMCFALGPPRSAGMIFAMHQTKIACLVRHGEGSRWHELMRRVAARQLLWRRRRKASGNIRFSSAAVERGGTEISLVRDATVISYGAEADGIVTIARRTDDAAGSDQVLLAITRDDYTLEPTLAWETLGMRGTCSAGFKLNFKGSAEQIFPVAYDKIHAQTMTPVAHLCWSSVWAGIAAAAVDRAQLFIRKAARGAGGNMPPGAAHFTSAKMTLTKLRALITANLESFAAREGDDRMLSSVDFQSSINLLKVEASELAVAAVMHAMRACGLSGYRNDTDVSVGRHLRDVLSAPIMINNDRILGSMGAATLMSAVPASLRD
jgi:acyl-CoA dehydrogenase